MIVFTRELILLLFLVHLGYCPPARHDSVRYYPVKVKQWSVQLLLFGSQPRSAGSFSS
jgi:hypothetical protein